MSEMNIWFMFDKKKYEVGMEAYDKACPIVLPDNTILVVKGAWLESYPPQPEGLERQNELPLGSTPEETATLIGGTVAHEV